MKYLIFQNNVDTAIKKLNGANIMDVAYDRDTLSTHIIADRDMGFPSMTLTEKSAPHMKHYLKSLNF